MGHYRTLDQAFFQTVLYMSYLVLITPSSFAIVGDDLPGSDMTGIIFNSRSGFIKSRPQSDPATSTADVRLSGKIR